MDCVGNRVLEADLKLAGFEYGSGDGRVNVSEGVEGYFCFLEKFEPDTVMALCNLEHSLLYVYVKRAVSDTGVCTCFVSEVPDAVKKHGVLVDWIIGECDKFVLGKEAV